MQQPLNFAQPQEFNPQQPAQMYNQSYYIVQNPYQQQPQQVYVHDMGQKKPYQQTQQRPVGNGAPVQQNGDNKPVLDLKKTQLCPNIKQGHCAKGDRCNFAHNNDELRMKPNLSKTKMCPNLSKKGHCDFGDNCNFAHSELELRSTPNIYKTSLCNNFMAGECKLGDLCRFAHGETELRKDLSERKPYQHNGGQQRGGYNNQRGGFNNQRGGGFSSRGGRPNINTPQAYQGGQGVQQQFVSQQAYMEPGKEMVQYMYMPQVRPQGGQPQYVMGMQGGEVQQLPPQYQQIKGDVPQFQQMVQPMPGQQIQGQPIPGQQIQGYQVQPGQQGQIVGQQMGGAQMVQNVPVGMGVPNMK